MLDAPSAESIVREIGQIDSDLVIFIDNVFTFELDRRGGDLRSADRQGDPQELHRQRAAGACRPPRRDPQDGAGRVPRAADWRRVRTQDATLKSMGKGFTIKQVRERFAVLRKSKMVINAYFIVGNIGETEEQMLAIAPFARSIGVQPDARLPAAQRAVLGLKRAGCQDAGLSHRRRRLRL